MANRRPWLDPRLIVGVVLVIASLAGVWLVVQQSSRTEQAWAATRTLLPGETIAEADVRVAQVRLLETAPKYLAGATSPVGMVVASTVGEGEVLPVRAVGRSEGVDRSAVVIDLGAGLPSGVKAGAQVNVWTAAPSDDGFAEPTVLVDGALVVDVVKDESFIADSGTRLELLVPSGQTGRLLEALANSHQVSVVPIAQPVAP